VDVTNKIWVFTSQGISLTRALRCGGGESQKNGNKLGTNLMLTTLAAAQAAVVSPPLATMAAAMAVYLQDERPKQD
jgi:hypothetical protein